jgi:hypothetical protein
VVCFGSTGKLCRAVSVLAREYSSDRASFSIYHKDRRQLIVIK